jgi:SAM-dependent methyltransferase
MKVCDVADWFRPEFAATVIDDLHETPRLHRKQWEFAAIFDELRRAGAVRYDARGISLGAGRELLLYALANRVEHIWATDLYSETTDWPDARTHDLEHFVRDDPPFPVNQEQLSVRDMDMRQIDFADESFDFAYSSSAIDHIGRWQDFRTHLTEVRRVLKPGGVYVMTTDIIYGPSWEEVGNFKFDPDGLRQLLHESHMAHAGTVDCRITRHLANAPLPSDLMTCLTPNRDLGRLNLFERLLQVQMLMGCHPHSSVVLTMRKADGERPHVAFPGYQETKEFLIEASSVWQNFAANAHLRPHPAAIVPAELRESIWATPYVWIGGQPRLVVVDIETDKEGDITIGVNRTHTDSCWMPVIDIPERVEKTSGHITLEFIIDGASTWNYAIYGRSLDGVKLRNVQVSLREGGVQVGQSVGGTTAPGRSAGRGVGGGRFASGRVQ